MRFAITIQGLLPAWKMNWGDFPCISSASPQWSFSHRSLKPGKVALSKTFSLCPIFRVEEVM
jgi:hypothetical protein